MTKMVHRAGKVRVTVPQLKGMMKSIVYCQAIEDHSVFNAEHLQAHIY